MYLVFAFASAFSIGLCKDFGLASSWCGRSFVWGTRVTSTPSFVWFGVCPVASLAGRIVVIAPSLLCLVQTVALRWISSNKKNVHTCLAGVVYIYRVYSYIFVSIYVYICVYIYIYSSEINMTGSIGVAQRKSPGMLISELYMYMYTHIYTYIDTNI